MKYFIRSILVVASLALVTTPNVFAGDGTKLESTMDESGGGSGIGLGADTDWGDMGQNFPDISGQPLELPDLTSPNESSPEDSCIGPACPGGMEIPGT